MYHRQLYYGLGYNKTLIIQIVGKISWSDLFKEAAPWVEDQRTKTVLPQFSHKRQRGLNIFP